MAPMKCVVLAGWFAVAAISAPASWAQSNSPALASVPSGPASKPSAPKVAKPYFVEFRARSALSYGHTFAVYGRVGAKIGAAQVAGLHPFTDSSVPWMIGHLVPVPSETGASDGDTEDKYIIARYRVLLTEPEYKKLVEGIKKLQASSPVWHAVLYNCNAFVGDIAKSIGLQIPSTMNMPKEFINDMKALNAPGAAVRAASTASSVH
jgi:hypothetical protein